MKDSLERMQRNIIVEILNASTQQEVKNICGCFVNQFERFNTKSVFIAQSLQETIFKLEQFNPMNECADKWSNIQTAKIELRRYILA